MVQTKTSHYGKVRYAFILLGWRYEKWNNSCSINLQVSINLDNIRLLKINAICLETSEYFLKWKFLDLWEAKYGIIGNLMMKTKPKNDPVISKLRVGQERVTIKFSL